MSQKLCTLGFPLGGFLKNIFKQAGLDTKITVKTRVCPITGRVMTSEGSVKYIQVEGGADPGNSGGAVIDTNGEVVAVLVAGVPTTNMRFVIPSEYVLHLLHGRVLRLLPGQAVRSGGASRQPITAQIADPMRRLRRVTAEVWAGKPGKVRPATDRPPDPANGDTPHLTAELAYNADRVPPLGESHTATAEFTLPPLGEGQVYWFQPHYTTKEGKERWGEAVVMEMGRNPVEAKPAALVIKHTPDRPNQVRHVVIDSQDSVTITLEGLGNLGGGQSLVASLTEKTRSVEPNGDAKVSLQYTDLRLGDKDRDTVFRKQLRGVLETVKNLGVEVTVTRDGRIRSPVPVWPNVPERARPVLRQFNRQLLQALEAMSLRLPNKDVQPGEVWSANLPFTIIIDRETRNVVAAMQCKFVGTRVRDGREEAVIELRGKVSGESRSGAPDDGNDSDTGGDAGSRGGLRPPGAPGRGDTPGGTPGGDEDIANRRRVQGETIGAAVVDVATGQVVLSRVVADFAVEYPLTLRDPDSDRQISVKVFVGDHHDVVLRRGLTGAPPKAGEDAGTLRADTEKLLPNLPRNYNPLVGVQAAAAAAPPPAPSAIPELSTAMPKEVFDKVKRAAVMIRANKANGGYGEGSGWFAEKGIVITNCHVVDMLSKTDRPPESIDVFLDKGEPTERHLAGKLLAVDREDDLAVIRVEGDNLPEPLGTKPAADEKALPPASKLTVFGFPLGNKLTQVLEVGLGARDLQLTVKARPTTVSGRINKTDDTVKYIYFEGGSDHGNSGGAIADAKGDVRAVVVGGIEGTQMCTGIPAEYAARLLQGYPLEVEPGFPYMDGSVGKQPVTVKLGDPLKRVKKVSVDYWVGPIDKDKPRKPSATEPKPEPGDDPHRTAELKYDPETQTATGEFAFPEVGTGRVLWIQPRYVDGSGKDQWARAITYAPDGHPVQRRPAVLAIQNKAGTRRVMELSSTASFTWQRLTELHAEGAALKATLLETTLQKVPKGVAPKVPQGGVLVQINYTDLDWDVPIRTGVTRLDSEIRRILKGFTDQIKAVTTYAVFTRDGVLKDHRASYAALPLGPALGLIPQFNEQIMQSLSALCIPLPNREVKYGETWEHPTNVFVETRNRYEAGLFTMKFKYLGVRDRGGRQEAVVEINGTLTQDSKHKSVDVKDLKDKPPPPPEGEPGGGMSARYQQRGTDAKARKGLYGLAKGYAYVDVAGGYVAEVKLFIDMDVELMVRDRDSKTDVPVMSSGTMEVLLKRLTSPGK
jgi:S1-C subfamily serine protease